LVLLGVALRGVLEDFEVENKAVVDYCGLRLLGFIAMFITWIFECKTPERRRTCETLWFLCGAMFDQTGHLVFLCYVAGGGALCAWISTNDPLTFAFPVVFRTMTLFYVLLIAIYFSTFTLLRVLRQRLKACLGAPGKKCTLGPLHVTLRELVCALVVLGPIDMVLWNFGLVTSPSKPRFDVGLTVRLCFFPPLVFVAFIIIALCNLDAQEHASRRAQEPASHGTSLIQANPV